MTEAALAFEFAMGGSKRSIEAGIPGTRQRRVPGAHEERARRERALVEPVWLELDHSPAFAPHALCLPAGSEPRMPSALPGG